MRCYCRRCERYSDACVLKRDLFVDPSVMVWGAISFHGNSEIILVQGKSRGHRYRYEIWAHVVVPFFNANRNVTLFQQVNVRCHTAPVSMKYRMSNMLGYYYGRYALQIFPQSKICDMCLVVALAVVILKTLTSWRSFYVRSGR